MYTKAKKTISHVTPERPLTKEEKQARIIQFLQQKREQFAVNILCNLVHVASERVVARRASTDLSLDTNGLVNSAVKMADELLEKLYPIEEEKPAEEEHVETDFD